MSDELITNETKPITRYSRYAKIGIFFTTLGLVILITAYGYGYFQLARVNMTLANMITQLANENTQQADTITKLSATVNKIEETSSTSNERLDAHDKLFAELNAAKKGDMNRWQIAEAQYLVKLAYERIMFSEYNNSALPLLERAHDMLQIINDSRINPIRDALDQNISDLKAQTNVDVGSVYNQITTLDTEIDKLELPLAPLSTDNKLANEAIDPDLPWWQKGLKHTGNILKQVVIIKRNDSNTLPIVMPDEKAYLYQNLHAQVNDLIWGLLHQQPAIYQGSISRMQKWISTYFVQTGEHTEVVLKELKALHDVNLTPQKIDLTATLKLFEQYLMSANSENSAQ